MGNANVNLECVRRAWCQIQSVESFCQRVVSYLDGQYQELGKEWRDKKYAELGELLEERCYQPLRQLGERTSLLAQTLSVIAAKVQEYENLNLLGTGGERSGSFRPAPVHPDPQYRTPIDEMVCEVTRSPLKEEDRTSFLDGEYRTVIAMRDLTLYRVFGGAAAQSGRFLTTEVPRDKLAVKTDSALPMDWGNRRTMYCEVVVPAGTKLHIGRVAPQQTKSGNVLEGGIPQVMLDSRDVQLDFGEIKPLGHHSNYLEFERRVDKLNAKND